MRATVFLVLLLVGCFDPTYTYVEAVRTEQVIDQPSYSAAVPPLSVFHAYPAKNTKWERYNKDDAPDDLILKEGYDHSSYAASVTVDKKIRSIGTIEQLKKYVATELNRKEPVEVQRTQPNLLCVMPQVYIEDMSDRPFFAAHSLQCIDVSSGYFYELVVSFMTKRKNLPSSNDLALGAQYFFSSFRVR